MTITINEAVFNVHALPQQGQALVRFLVGTNLTVQVETVLTITNDTVHSSIEGSVRFPLPEGCSARKSWTHL